MKCPHCAAESRHRERAGRVCPRCRRRFAVDPALDWVRGGDRRLRRIIERLGANGVKYSETQLWYAAVNRIGRAQRDRFWEQTDSTFWMMVLVFLAVPTYLLADRRIYAVVPPLIALVLLVVRLRHIARQPPPTQSMMIDVERFRPLLARWEQVYGAPPDGLVPDSLGGGAAGPPAGAAAPVVAVVAEDQAVRACLVANGLPERRGVRVVGSEVYVPPGVPVVVAHDASVAGYRFAERVRSTIGGRVIGTVAPRVTTTTRLRGAPPTDVPADVGADRDLLSDGWWTPLAALRPAVLVARVEAFAAATGIGYLTWPEAHGERP